MPTVEQPTQDQASQRFITAWALLNSSSRSVKRSMVYSKGRFKEALSAIASLFKKVNRERVIYWLGIAYASLVVIAIIAAIVIIHTIIASVLFAWHPLAGYAYMAIFLVGAGVWLSSMVRSTARAIMLKRVIGPPQPAA